MAFRGRQRSNFISSGRPRRPMDWWCNTFEVQLAAVAAECAWVMTPSEIHEELTDPTVMATRVGFGIQLIDTAVLGDTVGIGVIAWNHVEDALPDPCPNPITNCDYDWLWLSLIPLVAGQGDGDVIFQGSHNESSLSKARRRLGNDKSLLVVVATSGMGAQFHVHVRALVKE